MRLGTAVLTLTIATLFTGCRGFLGTLDSKYAPSNASASVSVKHEEATVVRAVHVPLHISARVVSTGVVINETEPEVATVIFECSHGTFAVENKEVYMRFKSLVGKKANVTYRMKHENEWEVPHPNNREVGHLFIDAVPE